MEKKFENIVARRFGYFNLYVIKGIDGDILIDTGFLFMKKRIKKWLDKFNVKLVILTHAHVDHIWNANYIKKLYGCKIAMSKVDNKNMDNWKIYSQPLKKRYVGWTKLMNFGMRMFNPEYLDVDIYLHDNQIINKYGLELKVISLPGHTVGSIGILYKNYLFAGDSLVNRKKNPTTAYQNQSNAAAIKTYNKIKKLDPDIIFVGHDKEIVRINENKESLHK